jgi:streptogramin lyase
MALIRAEQITGSVAEALFAVTASYTLSASYVVGAVTDRIADGAVEAVVDNASTIFLVKSGSFNALTISNTGATEISGSASNLFLIRNGIGSSIFTVSQSGVVIFATQSSELIGNAPAGGMYFTSNSFFVGLET